MQLGINTFQVRQSDFLLQNHLVETDNEVGIQEAAVEDTKPKAPADELEVIQVLWIDS